MTSIITAVVKDERLSPEEIDHRLSAHALMMAADLHCRLGGDDESFMQMAHISLKRTRANETSPKVGILLGLDER